MKSIKKNINILKHKMSSVISNLDGERSIRKNTQYKIHLLSMSTLIFHIAVTRFRK